MTMKQMRIHILLFHPEQGGECITEIVLPMERAMADKLLDAQRRGITIYEHAALYNIAAAVGFLHGLRGLFIRLEEVRK